MRSIPSLFLVLFASLIAHAQGGAHWTLQVKAGPQLLRLSDPIGPFNGPYTGRAVKGTGWFAGGALATPVRHQLGLRVELLYSMRGTGYTYDERKAHQHVGDPKTWERGERRVHAQYVELPVLFAWHRWPGLRLEGGPAVARLLRASEHAVGERAGAWGVTGFDESIDRTAAMAHWEWAGVLGAEVQGPNGLSLGLRYWMGFTDVDGGHGASPSQGSAWQFALAWEITPRGHATAQTKLFGSGEQ